MTETTPAARAAHTVVYVPGLARSAASTGEAVTASIRAAADLRSGRLILQSPAPAPEGLRAVGAIAGSDGHPLVDVYELDYRRTFEQLDRDDDGKEDAPPGVLTAVYAAVRVAVIWSSAFFRGRWRQPAKSAKARVQLVVGLGLALLFAAIALLVVAAALAAVVKRFWQWEIPVLSDPETVLWGGLAVSAAYVAARRAVLRAATVGRRVLRYYDEAELRQRLATEVERAVDDLLDEGYRGQVHLVAYSFGCSVVLDAVLCPKGDALLHQRVGRSIASLVTVGCPYDAERLFFPHRLDDRETITSPSLPWRNVFVASDLFGSNFQPRDDGQAGERPGPGGLVVRSIRWLPDDALTAFSVIRLAAFRHHTDYWHDQGGCWESVLDLWGLGADGSAPAEPAPQAEQPVGGNGEVPPMAARKVTIAEGADAPG